MGGLGVTTRLCAAAVLLMLAAAGCDASPLPAPPSRAALPSRTTNVPVTSVDTPPAEVGTPVADRELLTFHLAVPAGGPGCASRPQAQVVGYDERAIRVETIVESNRASYCTGTESRTVTARIGMRGRTLVVNGLSWKPGSGVGYVRCSGDVGCNPPQDRCDPVWTATLTPHFDLPPEKRATVVACAGRWLVMDIDSAPVGCRAGSARSCAGEGVRRRWFAELDPSRNWHVVASGAAAGCSDVHRTVPAFPTALCRSLPAR